jgi:lipopolysaccharide transport system ATP-binding protein
MVARLGVAVARAWRPDVLLLDEILAVGDEAFQRKCLDRLALYCDTGATVVLVTHDMSVVNTLCPKAVWIDHGRVQSAGPSAEVVRDYARVAQA